MKKFIVAFDGLNFSESSLEYAMFFARQSDAHLVGVFLEDFTRHSYSVADISEYASSFDEHIALLNKRDQEDRDESVSRFEVACQRESINYSIHRDRNIALQELLHESVYCDLLIICGGETLTRYEELAPTRFIRDLLSDVQCPVIVVPTRHKPVDKVSLLYDGGPSSVYAVKMFSYLFPNLLNLEAEVISVKSEDESLHLPDNKLMKEFMKRHYPKADYIVLKGIPEEEIVHYLAHQKKDNMIVLGAYKRSRVSRWFRISMADSLMRNLKAPLFIAHNKS